MVDQLRNAARKYLPGTIRRPLGHIAGKLDHRILQPLQGLLFDLRGGLFRVDGCTFIVPRELTTRSYRVCFWQGTYEKEERELVRRWIQPSDSVLELGACLGIVSCVTNKLLAEKSRHVVVEANPLCIPTLTRNKELNHAGFRVEHCAVGKPPEITFYLHPTYIVGGNAQRATSRPVRVPSKALLEFENESGPFTGLIMDIEGGELEVLEQSSDLLKQLRIIIIELHQFAIGTEGVEKCRDILRNSGLKRVDSCGLTEVWQRGN
jgi:FkbM family methyltransferase